MEDCPAIIIVTDEEFHFDLQLICEIPVSAPI
jgi:hypothetical protein